MAWGTEHTKVCRSQWDDGYGGWWPSAPNAAQRAKKAAKSIAARGKKGQALSPVTIEGRTIAKTFWGKAWCDNLEGYSDYANRLPRGRSYVRSGSVIDLKIAPGKVTALVQGSRLYTVTIGIGPVEPARWRAVVAACAGKVDSVVELLQGKLSSAVMDVITRRETGLFPSPRQIDLDCSCPDAATMCKHVAAVLYGVGARLDREPELLFRLRSSDPAELVSTAAKAGALGGKVAREKVLDADLASVFGIDLDVSPAAAPPRKEAPKREKVALPTASAPRAAKAAPKASRRKRP